MIKYKQCSGCIELHVAIFIWLVIFWGVGTVEMTLHFTIHVCTIVDAKVIKNPYDKFFLPNVELEALGV